MRNENGTGKFAKQVDVEEEEDSVQDAFKKSPQQYWQKA